ncbi:flagellar biosynthetic protein FliO [Desulfobacula toluolica]|uniref:Flagellar protein n=1 Tax=Desulfobacula toluolica (strain DSM 7467 / Tol2) TaxID=651182 RepID=K0NJQ6_DESTT|nr:flagellar biosynthetic protein FliO [Desulfobacula toluolica]CCK81731.1 flagellar biosynthetic protein, related to FliO [Desulfobacula toluolica Tol2]
MNTSSDIWVAFARTFSMLFLVLAVLILCFYLIKKFSTLKGGKGSKEFIKVLCVHHLSPKEKLVLLDVLGDIILVGVTPSNISKISSIEREIDFPFEKNESLFKFSDILTQKSGRLFKNKESSMSEKGKGS